MIRRPALLLVACMVPSVAWAQPSADAQARAAFERGIAEVDAGRFASAVVAFEESYRIRPVAVVLNNLAAAYARMGRYQLAIDTYQRYLTEGNERLSPERMQVVRERLAELRRDMPIVTLRVTPASYALTVDGRAVTVAVSGEVALDPGSHMFDVSAATFRSQRREFQLAPQAREVWELALDPVAPTTAVAPPTHAEPAPAVSAVAPTPHPPERPPPSPAITSRWWFWTGVGAVVLGGTALALGLGGVFDHTRAPLSGVAYDVSAVRW